MNPLQQLRNARMKALQDGTQIAPRDFRCEISSDAAEIYMFDIIDDWFGITAADVVMALQQAGGADVLVHVNCPGGMVTEGLAIYNTFKNYEGAVEFRIEGIAASAASFVVLAGNKVTIEQNAMFMIHDAWDVTIGPAAEHRLTADLLDKISDNLAGIYANKAGKNSAYWRDAMTKDGEGTWYMGQEAVDAGLVDEVSGTADSTAAAKWDRSIFAKAPINRVATVAMQPKAEPAYDFAALRESLKGVGA